MDLSAPQRALRLCRFPRQWLQDDFLGGREFSSFKRRGPRRKQEQKEARENKESGPKWGDLAAILPSLHPDVGLRALHRQSEREAS